MAVPMLLEVAINRNKGWEGFAFSLFVTGSLGSLLALANRSPDNSQLKLREAFILTTFSWVATSLFAALPLYWSPLKLSFIDCWFETVSALTTTGATVIQNLDKCPKGVLLWRSILQWLGGTGIVLMAMTVLPILRIGGMQLFRSEFSDRSEKILPRVSQISTAIVTIYLLLTLSCGLCLWAAGMTIFDAICHAMTTVSTGGLSTHDQSIGYYDSLSIELIISTFMIFGGITFILYIRVWQGHWQALYQDSQLRMFLLIIVITTLIITLWNYQVTGMAFLTSLRTGYFTVTSVISSTGFFTEDYSHWHQFPIMLILALSCIGGCTGSTSGGIKIFRFQILGALSRAHLHTLRRPNSVFVAAYQGQKIPEAVAASVLTFVTLYLLSFFALAALLGIFGFGILDSFSAAISVIGNAGAGITEAFGPSGTYADIAREAKLLLMFGMIMGRLELLTVFVLFMPSFWKS